MLNDTCGVHLAEFWILDNTIAGFKIIPSRYTWCSFKVRNRMDSIFSWTFSVWFISYSLLLNISGSTMGTIRALWQMLANLNKTRYSKIHQRKYVTHCATGILCCATTMFPNCFIQFPYANCCFYNFKLNANFYPCNVQQILLYIPVSQLWKAYMRCTYIGFMYDVLDEVYCATNAWIFY